ncbi:hypothetical protein P168DRAFT_315509 [Aspergillus campestris IBT 28561]|uniref:GPI anchored protein n=1 Tax=Aspergillus campestris (strain IBT 28561) TaxID=1392248 RepID=A0A2I1DAU1_ASPC2|nr:uncharacterized protein P168DRAFT_315509 [Aspergillus campestris IBT 28561]PKY06978.1 hypothetical protein P168DRAFT_315509 [Aspergillus campestris IBT 28561]
MHSNFLTLAVALLTGASSVLAADEVVTLFMPQADPQPLVGKVIATDGPLTTYVVYCADESDSDECGMPEEGYTVAAGKSTYNAIYSFQDYYLSQGCTISDSTYASCEISQHDVSTTHTDSASITMPSLPMLAVTITATELDGTTAKAKATAKASPERTGEAASTSTATSGAKNTPGAAADAASPSSSPTTSDNAAGARVTGMSGLVVGAAAVALGMVY